MADLGQLYRDHRCLWEIDFDYAGFEWVDFKDWEGSTVSFLRKGKEPGDYLLIVFNFTPVVRENYRLGAPDCAYYEEIFNSDADIYYGSNVGNGGGAQAESVPCQQWPCSISITLPPLGMLVFKPLR